MKKQYFLIIICFFLTIVLSIGFFVFMDETNAGSSGDSIFMTVKISVCGNNIKEGGEHCDGNALGGKTCLNLGFSGGVLHCTPSCEFYTTSCITSAGSTATPIFSPTNGGTYTMLNANNSAATVNLPQNFYTDNCDMRMQMFSYEKTAFMTSKPPPTGKNFCGKVYDFVFIDGSGTNISTLAKPASITLTYTDDEVSGFDENTLAPYRRGDSDSSWQPISGAVVDTANNTVTFSNTNFSSISLIGEPQTTSPASGNTGGGGGGTSSLFINAGFSGRAYPQSIVTLLKDGQIAGTVLADASANFLINLNGLSVGSYNFGLYATDSHGNRSALTNFSSSIVSGSNNITGLFIAPTMVLDKSEIKRGEVLNISGQTAPNSGITIIFDSENVFSEQTTADKNGAYAFSFNTAPLGVGQHFVKGRAGLNGATSPFSQTQNFLVGTKSVAADQNNLKGDLNGDKKINLVDFSILAYWYNRPAPLASADLNADGKVNLVDFSIMAYYWTG
jgi:hypothetical protein